jgi:hypothetical protein
MPIIRVIQANCRASEDILTALMSTAVRAGVEMVLIQEPSMRQEDYGWMSKIRGQNYIYVYSGREERPYVLTAIRKDVT